MVANIVNGITSIIVARLLGPSDFAIYGIALTLPTLLFSFSNLGVDQAIIRYVSKLQEGGLYSAAWSIIKSGYVIRLVLGIIAAFIGFMIAAPFSEHILQRTGIVGYVQFASLTVPFQASFWFSYQGFKGINRMSGSTVVRSLQAVSKAIVSIGLIWLGFSILGAITGFVSSYVFAGILGILVLWRITEKHDLVSSNSEPVNVKDLMTFGLSLYIITIVSDGIVQFRIILLANYFADEIIGNFNAAANITMIVLGFTVALVAVLFPAFSRLSSRLSPSEMANSLNLAVRYVSTAVVPVAFLTFALADEISLVLFGADYSSTPEFLRYLSLISLLIVFGAGVLESFMNGIGRPRYAAIIWGSYFIIFLALAPTFTIIWGIIGLIVSQLIGRAVSCGIGLGLGQRYLDIRFSFRGSVPIVVASFIAYLPIYIINRVFNIDPLLWLFVGALIFGWIYLTLLPFMKGIKQEDLDLLSSSFKPMPGIRVFVRIFVLYERKMLQFVSRKTHSE
jgi:O-antigen/teichoic acid export membrane protein